METKFNFKSQICTSREQSERLLALGLKKETADMYYPPFYFENSLIDYFDAKVLGGSVREEMMAGYEEYKDYIPAWSLHRLIEMIPKYVRSHSSEDDSLRHLYVPKFDYQGVTIDNIDEIFADFYQHTDLFDNIIDCIEWLIKEGYFNKEYLV